MRHANGATLPADSDVYNPVAAPGDASLVVTEAAFAESDNQLRLKVATGSAGSLGPLSSGQMTALNAYMHLVKDAGVRVLITTAAGDVLQLAVTIYYDALILDGTGARLDGTAATPVMDATVAFLAAVPFNGYFVTNEYIAAMQAVEGVVLCMVESAQASYDSLPFVTFDALYNPDGGYLQLDEGAFTSGISFVAQEPLS